VPFVRDAQGRITQITDTLGNNYLYSYDANGNLANVTYPGVATPAQYQYDPTHLYADSDEENHSFRTQRDQKRRRGDRDWERIRRNLQHHLVSVSCRDRPASE